MEKMAYKIVVVGKVQGVWFRKYTKQKADELSLKGFVRNETNGDVYIEVEGFSVELEKFIAWLSIGSPMSKVTKMHKKKIEVNNYNLFVINY